MKNSEAEVRRNARVPVALCGGFPAGERRCRSARRAAGGATGSGNGRGKASPPCPDRAPGDKNPGAVVIRDKNPGPVVIRGKSLGPVVISDRITRGKQ